MSTIHPSSRLPPYPTKGTPQELQQWANVIAARYDLLIDRMAHRCMKSQRGDRYSRRFASGCGLKRRMEFAAYIRFRLIGVGHRPHQQAEEKVPGILACKVYSRPV
jgi:hypothetical protein